MREIEFRLWCKNKNEWESDHWVIYPQGRLVDPVKKQGMSRETHILEQYTGLKDKDGVKIFEGDILNVEYNYIGNKVVKFIDGRFNICDFLIGKCSISGNIHEKKD